MRDYKISRQGTVLLIFLLIGLVSFAVFAENLPTENVLKAFRESFNWQNDVSLTLTGTAWNSFRPESLRHSEQVFHHDGKGRIRGTIQGLDVHKDTGIILTDNDQTGKFYGDQLCVDEAEGFLFYGLGDGDTKNIESLRIYEDGAYNSRKFIKQFSFTGFLLGRVSTLDGFVQDYLMSDTVDRITAEDLDGRSSYRIETELPEGTLSVWFSSEDGYAMQKWRLVTEVGEPVKIHEAQQSSGPTLKEKYIDRTITECSFSNFQKIDNFHVPSDIKYTSRVISGDKEELWKENTAQITAIELSPDFDASGAFDFPDYSQVSSTRFIKKDGTGLSGFKWEDGKLVADVDADALDDNIRTALAQIKTGSPSKNKGGIRFQMDGLDGASGFLFRHGRLLTWIAGALFLLACGGALALHLSRKGR